MPVYDSPRVALDRLLRAHGVVSASELAEAAGISRQAAHRLLAGELRAGALRVEGRARATRYRRAGFTWSWPAAGLEEHVVWQEVARHPAVATLGAEARGVAQYALTEMVNNAIDHASAHRVVVTLDPRPERLRITIEDDGEGAFAHVRALAGLPDELTAVQEISKGRFTTDPARHTGEGLFFTSKACARFALLAGALVWIVDNQLDEVALLDVAPRIGTRVDLDIVDPPRQPIAALFEAYTEDFAFVRTRTIVKLFEHGKEFVSRSEAKRLLAGLERFREVIVDFTGIAGIGQGFADEAFRVWPAAHPETRVLPANMGSAVAFMVRRALG